MVTKAVILFNTMMNKEEDVKKKLLEIPDVKDVMIVFGVYDLVAKLECDTQERLVDVVSWHIRRLENVLSTLTLVGI